MRVSIVSTATLTATAALTVAAAAFGIGSATAQPDDYTNAVNRPQCGHRFDRVYARSPVFNPNNQPGVEAVYTHRDGLRQITETVWVLRDAAAATAALNAAQADAAGQVANETTQPVQVGTGGLLLSGTSADGSKSISVLLFTEGNTASSIEFAGPPADPAPAELVTEFGQKQER